MKKIFFVIATSWVVATAGCEKDTAAGGPSTACNLPSTTVPDEMIGSWASGYNSFTQLVDTYNGRYLGNAWQSGKYFHFSANGKYAEFYYMSNAGLTSSTATKVIGTVQFDEQEGTFVFYACEGHYKGWQNGIKTVDRDATAQELANNLTQKYYYSFETSGSTTWMQIRFSPTGSPTSFRSVQ